MTAKRRRDHVAGVLLADQAAVDRPKAGAIISGTGVTGVSIYPVSPGWARSLRGSHRKRAALQRAQPLLLRELQPGLYAGDRE